MADGAGSWWAWEYDSREEWYRAWWKQRTRLHALDYTAKNRPLHSRNAEKTKPKKTRDEEEL